MDRLDAMSVLVAAVETGSLSAASRKLGTPLPTVSRKVSELETHLNTRLLIRSTRKLTLTDAGAAYVAACRRILEQVGDAERTASGEYSTPRGDLVVTAPIVFGRLHVTPAVNRISCDFPEIDVRLALSGPQRPFDRRSHRSRCPYRRAARQQHGRDTGRLRAPRRLRQPAYLAATACRKCRRTCPHSPASISTH